MSDIPEILRSAARELCHHIDRANIKGSPENGDVYDHQTCHELDVAAEHIERLVPKIKMTKTLPTDFSMYLWCKVSGGEMVSTYVFMYPDGPKVAHNGDFVYCKDIGGYWAKVDESMFEFEGE